MEKQHHIFAWSMCLKTQTLYRLTAYRMCLLHTAYHPGCCPSYLFYFSNSSPIELYIQRHERLWLSEALLDVHSCRWKTRSDVSGLSHLKSSLSEFFFLKEKQHVWSGFWRDVSRHSASGLGFARWRQAAGRVMEGREQVYISAWPAVTCADECALQLMNPAA